MAQKRWSFAFRVEFEDEERAFIDEHSLWSEIIIHGGQLQPTLLGDITFHDVFPLTFKRIEEDWCTVTSPVLPLLIELEGNVEMALLRGAQAYLKSLIAHMDGAESVVIDLKKRNLMD